ncbi:MAG: cyclase family protein [Bacteroidota bacterium]
MSSSQHKIIDLTLSYHEGMAGYQSEVARTVEVDGWNAKTLHLYSHAGTHMDAPWHFGVNDRTIDRYLPDRLMGKAWIAHIPNVRPNQLLRVEDLGPIADIIQWDDNLLIRTDWSKHINDSKVYRDGLPRISAELAHWCVEKGINILGVEPPSVADVNNLEEVTRIHHILLGGDVIIVEGLCNLDQIQTPSCWLIALPLKIHQGDGAPARVVAREISE